MTPEEYLETWTSLDGKVNPISLQKLADFKLQPSTVSYLKVGLPEDAAPYISFVNDSNDLYKAIAKLESIYDIEPDKYIVIGSDGSGNPIVVNIQSDDTIEWLDHENYFEPEYCNRSLECLLTFLIIYRDFIVEIIEINGEDAFLDGKFTDEQFDKLKQRMIFIDPVAVNQPGFWQEELNVLLANREYFSNGTEGSNNIVQ